MVDPEILLTFAGHTFTGRALFERAMYNAINRERRPEPAWVLAKRVFAVGSTVAMAMCRDLGIDPDTEVGPGDRMPS